MALNVLEGAIHFYHCQRHTFNEVSIFMGFVYIASNPGLKKGLVKIGISKEHPSGRLAALGRSTAVPADFVLNFSCQTPFADKVERRVHAVLADVRFRESKEFFQISASKASEVIERIVEHTETPGSEPSTIGTSPQFNWNFDPFIRTHSLQLMVLTMGWCNFVHSRKAGLFPKDIVDGFLDAEIVSKHLRTSRAGACRAMRRFSSLGLDLSTRLMGSKTDIHVFDKIGYTRGEMWWLFSDDFIPHFINDKI